MKKRLLAVILVICMVVSMMPTVAFAADGTDGAIALAKTLVPLGDSYDTDKVEVDGNKVTLKTDLTLSGNKAFAREAVLDLATYTIDMTTGRLGVTAADPNVGNLTITGQEGSKITNSGAQHVLQAQKNGTIVIDGDVTVEAINNGVVLSGGNLVIKGGAIKSANGTAVQGQSSSNITMTGGEISGKVGIKATSSGAAIEMSGGTITGGTGIDAYGSSTVKVSGGEITTTGYSITVFDTVSLTVDAGTVEGEPKITSTDACAITTNGSETKPEATIAINGGTIKGSDLYAGIYLPAGGLTVSEGGITGGAGIVVRGGTLTVNGGNITATGSGDINVGDAGTSVPAAGIAVDKNKNYSEGNVDVTITGGTITSTNAAAVSYTDNGSDDNNTLGDDDNVSITGGTFTGADGESAIDDELLPDGNEVGDDGTLQPSGEAVVKVGDLGYTTLEAAIAAAADGDTVTFLQDIEDCGDIWISKNITLELGDHTLNLDADCSVIAYSGAEVTINGGKIIQKTGSNRFAAVQIGNSSSKATVIINGTEVEGDIGILVRNAISLEVNDSDITGRGFGITSNGSDANKAPTITISGGTVTSTAADACGIYLPAGDLTVKDVDITGGAGIVVRGGTLTVNGGTITGKAQGKLGIGDAKNEIPAGGIVADNADGYEVPSVTVNSGTVKAAEGQDAIVYTENGSEETEEEPDITVNGGTFSSDVTDYLGEDKDFDVDSEGNFTVKDLVDELPESGVILYVNDKAVYDVAPERAHGAVYKTADEAVAAALAGDTIKFRSDVVSAATSTTAGIFTIDKSLVIDLNGHTLSKAKAPVLSIPKDVEITITDSSADESGIITSANTSMSKGSVQMAGAGSKVVMDKGTVECTGSYPNAIYGPASSEFIMNGGRLVGELASYLYNNTNGYNHIYGGSIEPTKNSKEITIINSYIALASPDTKVVLTGTEGSDATTTTPTGTIEKIEFTNTAPEYSIAHRLIAERETYLAAGDVYYLLNPLNGTNTETVYITGNATVYKQFYAISDLRADNTIVFDIASGAKLTGELSFSGPASITWNAGGDFDVTITSRDEKYVETRDDHSVELATTDLEAQILGKDKKYAYLTTALNNAESGDTVLILMDEVKLKSYVWIYKDITIDLQGNTINYVGSGAAFIVQGGKLTLKSTGDEGTVKRDAASSAAGNPFIGIGSTNGTSVGKTVVEKNVVVEGDIGVFNASTLDVFGTVNGGSSFAISGNGTLGHGGSTIIIHNGATVTSTGSTAIYHPQSGTLIIGCDEVLCADHYSASTEGPTVTGTAGVVMRDGQLTVNGGTITGTAQGEITVGDAGHNVPAGGIVVDNSTGYGDENGTGLGVTVNGGTVEAAEGQSSVIYAEDGDSENTQEDPDISIKGGTFTSGGDRDATVIDYVDPDADLDENGTVVYNLNVYSLKGTPTKLETTVGVDGVINIEVSAENIQPSISGSGSGASGQVGYWVGIGFEAPTGATKLSFKRNTTSTELNHTGSQNTLDKFGSYQGFEAWIDARNPMFQTIGSIYEITWQDANGDIRVATYHITLKEVDIDYSGTVEALNKGVEVKSADLTSGVIEVKVSVDGLKAVLSGEGQGAAGQLGYWAGVGIEAPGSRTQIVYTRDGSAQMTQNSLDKLNGDKKGFAVWVDMRNPKYQANGITYVITWKDPAGKAADITETYHIVFEVSSLDFVNNVEALSADTVINSAAYANNVIEVSVDASNVKPSVSGSGSGASGTLGYWVGIGIQSPNKKTGLTFKRADTKEGLATAEVQTQSTLDNLKNGKQGFASWLNAQNEKFMTGGVWYEITWTVAGGESITETYHITLANVTLAPDVELDSLELSTGTLDPVFASDTKAYTATVGNSVDSITVTATADAQLTITVNGKAVTSGTASDAIALTVGENEIKVAVTYDDTTVEYVIKVTREAPVVALDSLTISEGTLAPAFAADTTAYTATVGNSVDSITVTATADAQLTITVNGKTVASGTASDAIALAVGENEIKVVAAYGTTTVEYVVTVTREAPVVALDSLTISEGTLAPAFAADTTAYTATVGNSVDSITVTATADAQLTITVNGKAVTSGTASDAIALAVGENEIKVVAAYGTTTVEYVVTVTREAPVVALDSLTISEGTLAPAFAADTTAYTATVGNSVDSITVTATADAQLTITVNGNTVTSGTASDAIALAVGENEIKVVAAYGTTTVEYVIKVTREAPVVALGGLEISAGTLTPDFAADVTEYTATVASDVDSITVTAAADAQLTITVNGKTVAAGAASDAIDLDYGENTITVAVTYGTTTVEYTIKVTREIPVVLDDLAVSVGTLTPEFDADTTTYSVGVFYNVSSIKVTPTAAEGLTIKVNGTEVESGAESDAIDLIIGENIITIEVTDGTTTAEYTVVVTRARSTGGGGYINTPAATYNVSVSSDIRNGVVTVSQSSAVKGTRINITVTPDYGYELNTITVIGSNRDVLTVYQLNDGSYYFTMPENDVEVAATFKVAVEKPDHDCPSWAFTDINVNQWHHEAVDYVVGNGLMKGMGNNVFSPDSQFNRAMLMVMLARLDGVDTAVAEGEPWYATGLAWAVENGVSDGSDPLGLITREQAVTMIYNYCKLKGYDVSGRADFSNFADGGDVSVWAEDAMSWAASIGLVEGRNNNFLAPKSGATRAEMATLMMRFCETIAK